MEGTLWKWTNYFSGWQPRWFVLENGILSYYKSQDDVVNGCKGSIKIAVCDVNVHGTDPSRLDLIIPGEAHFYVKAATPQERQQWLVALGSAKACLTNGKPAQSLAEIPEEQLKAKKSELRLFCDLLMQQVHSVKSVIEETQPPNVQKLNEATSLLSATCDTFIKTLDDCMQLSSAQMSVNSSSLSSDVPLSGSPSKRSPSTKTVPWNAGSVQRSMSVDSYQSLSERPTETENILQGYIPASLKGHRLHRTRSNSRTYPESSELSAEVINSLPHGREASVTTKEVVWLSRLHEVRQSLIEMDPDTIVPTYFTNIPVSFKDVHLDRDGHVPTKVFLEACYSILPIVDKLNPTAFTPVKLDIDGNIKKIYQKYSTDTEQFSTLQKIASYEISHKQHTNPNSATVALLWLKRGLEFTHQMALQYVSGVRDLAEAATTAYVKTLKRYHSWVVRGVFALAVKKVPTHDEFLRHLSVDVSDVENPNYEMSLVRDIDAYAVSMEDILKSINEYYKANHLDSDEQV